MHYLFLLLHPYKVISLAWVRFVTSSSSGQVTQSAANFSHYFQTRPAYLSQAHKRLGKERILCRVRKATAATLRMHLAQQRSNRAAGTPGRLSATSLLYLNCDHAHEQFTNLSWFKPNTSLVVLLPWEFESHACMCTTASEPAIQGFIFIAWIYQLYGTFCRTFGPLLTNVKQF